MAYSYGQLEQLWMNAGGSRATAAVAAAVAMAESGGDPTKTPRNSDGSIDRGLWQINSVHGALSTTDVAGNAKAAVKISKGGKDWSPWVTYWKGTYKKFLQGNVSPDGTGLPTGSTSVDPAFFNPLDPFSWGQAGGDVLGSAISDGMLAAFKGVAGPLFKWMFWTGQMVAGMGLMGVGVFLLVRNTGVVRGVEKATTAIAAPEAAAVSSVSSSSSSSSSSSDVNPYSGKKVGKSYGETLAKKQRAAAAKRGDSARVKDMQKRMKAGRSNG